MSADVICYPGTHADVLEETRLWPHLSHVFTHETNVFNQHAGNLS